MKANVIECISVSHKLFIELNCKIKPKEITAEQVKKKQNKIEEYKWVCNQRKVGKGDTIICN